MKKESEIKLFITIDEKKTPEKIEWEADDAEISGKKNAQTVMLSLWDEKDKMTYSIDLWTKEMTVEDMNVHFHQIFLKMADTFQRATRNTSAADLIKKFSSEFADELGLKNIL